MELKGLRRKGLKALNFNGNKAIMCEPVRDLIFYISVFISYVLAKLSLSYPMDINRKRVLLKTLGTNESM